MDYFLNIDEKSEEQARLSLAYANDPEKIKRTILDAVGKNSAYKEIGEEYLNILSKTDGYLRRFLEDVDRFERAIPERKSVFRGGDDSQEMFRRLCPMMEKIALFRGCLRGVCINLGLYCQRIDQMLVVLTRADWQCRLLKTKDDAEEDFSRILLTIEDERGGLERLLKLIFEISQELSHFDAEILARILSTLEQGSGVEHDGMNCDCGAVLSAFSALKEATCRLKEKLSKRRC